VPERPGTPIEGPPDWVPDAVFYQIFPDRFASSSRVQKPRRLEPWDEPPTVHGFKGGDLLGIAERLDHIEELGANAIYLNPVFASASNHRYHTYDYFRVDPLLGGNEALRELLDTAHARGIRVILDGVFNHASRGFWPFHHILETGPQSPYLDWFTVLGWPLRAYDPDRPPNYAAWWNLHALPKFNVSHPEAREYLLDVAEHWIRFGADGWRLDVPHEIDDPDFWRTFRRRVRTARPDAYLVGEIWNEAQEWLEGDRFDGLMNYPFSRTAAGLCAPRLQRRFRPGGYRLRRLPAKVALEELAQQTSIYRWPVVQAQLNLLGSHDTPRFLTLAGGDHKALHLAVLLQMTLPGAPAIYYGDEVGLDGGNEPACRGSFPWKKSAWHHPTWEHFRRAIALRHSEPALRRGSFLPLHAQGSTLAFLRMGPDHALVVVLNVGLKHEQVSVRLPEQIGIRGVLEELWARRARRPGILEGNRLEARVAARSGRVLRIQTV
jgi:neopullulanase